MDVNTYFSLFVILGALVALFVPDRYIRTDSCKRQWIVVMVIVAAALRIVDKTAEGNFVIFLLLFCLAVSMLKRTIVHLNTIEQGRKHEQ